MTVQALTPDATRSERVPQINIEAEHELLGALIMRPASIAAVQAILLPEHFGEHLHSVIYEAILAAVEAGQTPSIAMVRQFLGARDYTADLGSGVTLSSYIAGMMASAPRRVKSRRDSPVDPRPVGSSPAPSRRRRYRPEGHRV